MTNPTFDEETLRALADEGNEKALDRLADHAEERGDLAKLNELLDEGCRRAGILLTRHAVDANNLLELQRLFDAGSVDAAWNSTDYSPGPRSDSGTPGLLASTRHERGEPCTSAEHRVAPGANYDR